MSWLRQVTYTRCAAFWPVDTRQLHAEHGFTLHEVMVAMVIFAFGYIGYGGMQLSAMRLNASAQSTTQLATVAQEHMEALLALPFTDKRLQDSTAPVNQGTAYCVLYPPEGVGPCQATTLPSAPYCVVDTQPWGASNCDTLEPPATGFKVQWCVNIDPPGQLVQVAHVSLTASRKAAGTTTSGVILPARTACDPLGGPPTASKGKTFTVSFARSSLSP